MKLLVLKDTKQTTVTGLEMFKKSLDESQAGDNVGVLLRGVQKIGNRTWDGFSQTRFNYTAH